MMIRLYDMALCTQTFLLKDFPCSRKKRITGRSTKLEKLRTAASKYTIESQYKFYHI